jgi:hypothetical protein
MFFFDIHAARPAAFHGTDNHGATRCPFHFGSALSPWRGSPRLDAG